MKKTIQLCLGLPALAIWWFLLHTILAHLAVDRLVWFLFWIYVPIGFIMSIIDKTVEDKKK